MAKYLALLRGINVGGKNKVSMSQLKEYVASLGYKNVSTYINSGNLFLESEKSTKQIATEIEKLLPQKFKLDSKLIKILVLAKKDLQVIVENAPKQILKDSDKYYRDVIFLIDIDASEALRVFDPRAGIDRIWPGKGGIYSQRLGSQRTKSRLGKIIGTPAYKSMTIRSWKTTTKLLQLFEL